MWRRSYFISPLPFVCTSQTLQIADSFCLPGKFSDFSCVIYPPSLKFELSEKHTKICAMFFIYLVKVWTMRKILSNVVCFSEIPNLTCKGQLFSKCPFVVIVWTKIPTKKWWNHKIKALFIVFSRSNDDPKRTFWN